MHFLLGINKQKIYLTAYTVRIKKEIFLKDKKFKQFFKDSNQIFSIIENIIAMLCFLERKYVYCDELKDINIDSWDIRLKIILDKKVENRI